MMGVGVGRKRESFGNADCLLQLIWIMAPMCFFNHIFRRGSNWQFPESGRFECLRDMIVDTPPE